MNTETIHPAARTTLVERHPRVQAKDTHPAGGHRVADYVVDVFFIVLLAAPFVIFQAPAWVQDTVVAVQPAADTTYGPE